MIPGSAYVGFTPFWGVYLQMIPGSVVVGVTPFWQEVRLVARRGVSRIALYRGGGKHETQDLG